MKKFALLLIISLSFSFCKNTAKKETSNKTLKEEVAETIITPISHATAVIEFDDKTIYIDPTGGKKSFEGIDKPTMVFITDIHGDHMNIKTLKELDLTATTVVGPKAVIDKISTLNTKEFVIINNGESKDFGFLKVEAIPMYNLRKEALKFHEKGRGNGYVFTINNERIYFSGDTEDIPEMRALQNIDKAFVCMNLPYTMTVESAASAVLEFKPKQVFPYHYRGTGGFSDVEKFKKLVNEGDKEIEVVQLDWYQ